MPEEAAVLPGPGSETEEEPAANGEITIPRSKAVLLERILATSAEVEEKRREHEDQKLVAKDAKDAYESARDRLVALCRGTGLQAPLLDLMEPDGWKDVPLSDAVGPKYAELLMEKSNGVIERPTLGCLVRFLTDHPFTDIRGIGPTTGDKISDELFAFWTANPQWTPPTGQGLDDPQGAPVEPPPGLPPTNGGSE